MSQSQSFQRDTASASLESPKEGDFFFPTTALWQPREPEGKHETCDDRKDADVNILPDNLSGFSFECSNLCSTPDKWPWECVC